MNFSKYQRYKHSGVETLGEIPRHWEATALKRLLAEPMSYGANESADDDTPDNPRFVRITDITESGELRDETFRSLPPQDATPYLLQNGDVLLARSGATVGKSFIYRTSWGICCFAGYLIRARADRNKLRASFLYYCCQTNFYWNVIASEQIQATIQNVSAQKYGNIILPVPPLPEQSNIVAFLDREAAKIDALVAEQEKLIELLKEKRQAVISHAVTKGLDPNVPMKDSCVEWLGEVPEHWSIIKISHLFSAKKGSNAAQLTKEYCAEIEGEHPVYSGQTDNNGVMAFINEYEFDTGIEGVVLSTTVGAKAMSVSHINGKFSLSQNCMIIISKSGNASIRFFYYHFQPLFKYERDMIPCHMQPSFRMEDLYGYFVALPPLAEQEKICAHLDSHTAQIDELVSESEKAIILLKERRSALISAAVTGKIDVRGLAETTQ